MQDTSKSSLSHISSSILYSTQLTLHKRVHPHATRIFWELLLEIECTEYQNWQELLQKRSPKHQEVSQNHRCVINMTDPHMRGPNNICITAVIGMCTNFTMKWNAIVFDANRKFGTNLPNRYKIAIRWKFAYLRPGSRAGWSRVSALTNGKNATHASGEQRSELNTWHINHQYLASGTLENYSGQRCAVDWRNGRQESRQSTCRNVWSSA